MIELPIAAGRGMNNREHWRARAARVKKEREAAAWLLVRQPRPKLPCSVLLIRQAPSNGLDDDNLAGSLKSVRDEVARWLGVDDRDRMTVRYRYAQRRGPWAVLVEFGEPAVGAQFVIEMGEEPPPAPPPPAQARRAKGAAAIFSGTAPADLCSPASF